MLRRLAAIAAIGLLAGCGGKGLSREGLETRYIDSLIEAGVDEPVAECVIGRLFDEFSDADLRSFNTEGTELTDAQAQRVAELTVECGPQ